MFHNILVVQLCLTLCDPMDYTVHGILQARILEWVNFPFSRGSSQPRDQTQVSHIAGGFFTSWATGKPKNTGVGSLSLLQGIFLTQESNQGLLHCRPILYQLSYREAQTFMHRLYGGKKKVLQAWERSTRLYIVTKTYTKWFYISIRIMRNNKCAFIVGCWYFWAHRRETCPQKT